MPCEEKIWSPSLSEEWYKELDTLFLSNGTSFLPSGKRQGRHKQTVEFILPEIALCCFKKEKMLPSVKSNGVRKW